MKANDNVPEVRLEIISQEVPVKGPVQKPNLLKARTFDKLDLEAT
jgi:hypothetical protein